MLFAGIIALVGIVLLIFGLRGQRVGPDPRCRKCDHVVVGLPVPICPECGADLASEGAVVQGMRRRRWWLAGFGAGIAVCFGIHSGLKTYDILTQPGWEHRVPGWWLAKVEMRFANGKRFNDALTGVFYGRDTGRISVSSFEECSRHGFTRFYSELQLMTKPSRLLELPALEFAETAEAEPQKVAWSIRQYVSIEKRFPKTMAGVMTPAGTARMGFDPGKWELHSSYDITNAEGRSIGNSGTYMQVGRYSTIVPSGSNQHDGPIDYGPTPFTCTWKFKLMNPDFPTIPPYEWTETYEYKPLSGYGPVGATR